VNPLARRVTVPATGLASLVRTASDRLSYANITAGFAANATTRLGGPRLASLGAC
jgi:hypothetical protein